MAFISKCVKFVLFGIVFLLSFQYGYTQSSNLLDSIIVFDSKSVTIGDLINEIETVSTLKLSYSPSYLSEETVLDVCKSPCSISYYLKLVAEKEDVEIVQKGNLIYLIKNFSSNKTKKNIFSLSGYIKDVESGEKLIGATVFNTFSKKGMLSDEYGYFSFRNINVGDTIKISYIGYSPVYINSQNGDIKGDFFLEKSNVLSDILIDYENSSSNFSFSDFEHEKTIYSLKGNSSLLESTDVLKELTNLPGISKINDFQGGVSVNGLIPEDNLYLLDGVRIFEPNHLFGLFSTFNNNSINKVSIYTNYIPSKFVGAFSAVIDSHLKEGDFKKHSVDLSINNANLGMFVSGPILKYKTSYFIDIRKSLLNLYVPELIKETINFDKIDFYDVNMKITHRINMGNKISLFLYNGNDGIIIKNSYHNLNVSNDYNWGNLAYGLKWEKLFANSVKSNLSFSVSKYYNNSYSGFELNKKLGDKSYLSIYSATNIREILIKQDISYYLENTILRMGYGFSIYNVLPTLKGQVSDNYIIPNSVVQSEIDSVNYNGKIYLLGEQTFNRIKISSGIQMGYLFKNSYSKLYINPQCKISYKINGNSFFDVSFMKTSKYLHSLGSYSIGIPSMIWMMSDESIPLSRAYNYSLSYMLKKPKFTFKTELYYKKLKDIIQFRSIADTYSPVSSKGVVLPVFISDDDIYKNIVNGEGKAYGVNMFFSYELNKLEMDYSFSINRVFSKFNSINDNELFVGKYDVLYASIISMKYNVSKFNYFMNWKIHSGQVFTLPSYIYNDIDGLEVLDYSKRNNERMPLFNSVSLGISYWNEYKSSKYSISFGVSNVFNNFNPVYTYLYKKDSLYKAAQVSGIPFLPYLKINISF